MTPSQYLPSRADGTNHGPNQWLSPISFGLAGFIMLIGLAVQLGCGDPLEPRVDLRASVQLHSPLSSPALGIPADHAVSGRVSSTTTADEETAENQSAMRLRWQQHQQLTSERDEIEWVPTPAPQKEVDAEVVPTP
ncbi:MAG: hypothetical protein AAF539_11145 [Planctomycetota bacterium]